MQNRGSTGVGGKENNIFYMLAIHLPKKLVIANDDNNHRNEKKNDTQF